LDWIEQLIVFPCQIIDHRLVRIAIEKSERFGISYWDAAILAAAEALGAETVYSEGPQRGAAIWTGASGEPVRLIP
jgi:predicted nucleic acid-binding protein